MTRLLLGTTKGAFILSEAGADWRVSGPLCDGAPVNQVIADADGRRLWAAGGNDWLGIGVWHSTDGGATWELHRDGFELDEAEGPLVSVWSVARVGDRLLAGTKPAALFESRDDGRTWARVRGLTDHPSRPDWAPGGAGLVLHTIISDPDNPDKIWVGISTAGVFATDDGGATWAPRNTGTRIDYAPEGHQYPEVGQCVHNLVRATGAGDRLYQQNHFGTYRSSDGGRNWQSIETGLPSTFGFPIAVDPDDADRVYVFPLNGDSIGRYPPDARAALWRSDDGGESWSDCRDGLPAENCFFTVLRQAMTSVPGGVAFGTNTGSVFLTRDRGASIAEVARHMPTILSVEAAPGA
ncbi:WD40/YVTN/BNR-like repeat-containing protein [Oceanomicrobium pacificus]|uniref:Exo-alpha-sialidase n=1 Tax=Oceanomicrobium pacificus TaxID=2692916 RepID=A0A6B0U2C8_9RHOB|nr:sialidase family protein [Oceanomicrobium pacificus]MXU65181.1 exo-alpha-sialidase [Oceanomicrobium pacificus]